MNFKEFMEASKALAAASAAGSISDPETDEHRIIETSREVEDRTALVSEYVIDGVVKGHFKFDDTNPVHQRIRRQMEAEGQLPDPTPEDQLC